MTVKTFSGADVLGSYLQKPAGFGGWLKTIFQTEEVKIQISLPTRCFLRLEMFCEDVQEYCSTLNNPLELDFSIMVELLLEDVVSYYGSTNNVLALHKQFQGLEKLPLAIGAQAQRREKFTIRLDRKLVFRLEMLLADISEFEDHNYSVERVLTLCLLNFLSEIFRGNGQAVQKSIIKRLK